MLTQLALINDSPTAKLSQTPSTPKGGESRIPSGVRTKMDLSKDIAPSKQFSLWAHYSYRMGRAAARKDAAELLKLAACATRDLEIHHKKRAPFHASHESAVTELLRNCTGLSAVEASWWTGAQVEWVRRQRVLHGRDAELGEPRRVDEQTKRILAMKEAGASVRTIAAETGIAKSTVHDILTRGGTRTLSEAA